jgi:hypothetical protein
MTMKVAACILALVCASALIWADLPVAPSFTEVVVPVGKGPGPIAVTDLNRDGKPDIVVANQESEDVCILLGDGKGHFLPSPNSPFPVGHLPNDIAIGDFNGDGNPDLVIPNHQTPYVTILLGDGRGGFRPAPHSPFSTQSRPHPHGAVAADFNGDGKLDVVIDSWADDRVLLLLGDGAGNLIGPGRFFPVGKRPYQRLRSADFNKDGKPDLVTTNLDGNNVTILLGDGKGGFREAPGSPFPAGAAPWAVAIDDINRDGNPDLVVVPYAPDVKGPSQIVATILLGDGKGGFTPMRGSLLPLHGCQGPNGVATGDINGDGFRDIVVSCAQSNNIVMFLGSKTGAFQPSIRQFKDTGWSGLAVADLNGDGKDDIVVGNSASGTITILVSK